MVDTAQKVGTWAVDASHSSVEFAVKHMMFSTAKGRFGQFSGTIDFDAENIAASTVSIQIDPASIDTRDEKRDGHLRSADFFDVERFPTVTFTSTAVKPNGGDAFAVHGDLTIRGISKPVVLETEVTGRGTNPWGQEVIGFTATTKFKRSAYGLEWNAALEAGGVLVGDDIKITIELEATR